MTPSLFWFRIGLAAIVALALFFVLFAYGD